jgi:hypothetical protein
VLTNAGGTDLGKTYVQIAFKRGGKNVDRPTVFSKFFDNAGAIDHINSIRNYQLDVPGQWAPKKFWLKNFLNHEGARFTDMYMMHLKNGMLEQMEGSNSQESVQEFMDRFCGTYLKPTIESMVSVQSHTVTKRNSKKSCQAEVTGCERRLACSADSPVPSEECKVERRYLHEIPLQNLLRVQVFAEEAER